MQTERLSAALSIMSKDAKNVLCIGPNRTTLELRKEFLKSFGFEVWAASKVEEALKIVSSQRIDGVVAEFPFAGDVAGVLAIKEIHSRIPIVVICPDNHVVDAVLRAVDAVITPDDEPTKLVDKLGWLIQIRSHEHEELQSKYVVFADSRRRYVDCSDAVCDLIGYSRPELLDRSIEDVSRDLNQVVNLFEDFRRQTMQSGEFLVIHKEGRSISLRYDSYFFCDGCIAAVWEPQDTWRQAYEAALVEVDDMKLRALVHEARAQIYARLGATSNLGRQERQELSDALQNLATVMKLA